MRSGVAEPKIPGYSIVERLGSGGFATVYRALDDESQTDWAIKVLHDHAAATDDLKRFERERTTMQALRHDNIVSVRSHGETEEGSHYTVLEYVGGGSVRDRIKANGSVHWGEALAIGVQISAALDIAHRSGVLHRDVKPANILLDGDTAKLTDFGIARLVGQSAVTAAQSIIGTLAYTPPELFHNKAFDGRGDIYQLGVTLYEMLLGRAPFTSAASENKATIIRRILENPAPPLAQFDIPIELSDLLDEVLAKESADRPQTAARFGERLREVQVALGVAPATAVGAVTEPFSIFDEPDSGSSEMPVSQETDLSAASTAPEVPPQFSIAKDSSATVDPAATIEPQVSVDPDATIVEPMPQTTGVLHQTPSTPDPEPQQAPVVPTQPRTSEPAPAAAPPSEPASTRRNGALWLAAAGIALLAIAGVLIGTQLTGSGDDDSPVNTESTVVDPNDDGRGEGQNDAVAAPTIFVPFASDAFTGPDQAEGIAFGSVTNSGGLTIVGASGSGTDVASQRPEFWTIGPSGGELQSDHRPEFASDAEAIVTGQRSWGIGVIDRETFLVVGDTTGAGGTDGLAWFGAISGEFVPVADDSFAGSGADSLRSVEADGSNSFLVAGRRTSADVAIPSLWQVTRTGGAWAGSEWTVLDIASTGAGTLHDVAVDGDLAAAVGVENIDGTDSAILKVRRDGQWQDLLAPLPDATLLGVTISGDRIVAVGMQDDDAGTPRPIAVIADPDGIGSLHNLPIRGSSGLVRDVVTRADGTVVAVGDDLDDATPGAGIWELIPGDELPDDRWTTRASGDLANIDGFVELWSISEFDDQLFVFGRTESDDQLPAGAWLLNLG